MKTIQRLLVSGALICSSWGAAPSAIAAKGLLVELVAATSCSQKTANDVCARVRGNVKATYGASAQPIKVCRAWKLFGSQDERLSASTAYKQSLDTRDRSIMLELARISNRADLGTYGRHTTLIQYVSSSHGVHCCPKGYGIDKGKCVAKCAAGYEPNKKTGLCEPKICK